MLVRKHILDGIEYECLGTVFSLTSFTEHCQMSCSSLLAAVVCELSSATSYQSECPLVEGRTKNLKRVA